MKKSICLVLLAVMLLLPGCEIVSPLDEYLPVASEPDYSAYPQIENTIALRDFVVEQQKKDILEFSLVYTGAEPLPEDIFTKVTEACFVSYSQQGDGPWLYNVTLTEFPGQRIADAYFSQDHFNLSADEKMALDVAVEMVESAKAQAENDYELELLLYQALAEKITYYDDDVTYDKPEDQPWFLNAVGALTKGQANCQGYADAFYTVASIAGFQVGRMGVETPGDPHMVNTICLDDQWYVVDVTYGDTDSGPVDYRLLNAGMDMIGEYWWAPENEHHPIAEVTNPDYYYYLHHAIAFDTPKETAQYIAETWATTNQKTVYAMLRNESDPKVLNDHLHDALVELNQACSYSIWYSGNGKDSFFIVVFAIEE